MMKNIILIDTSQVTVRRLMEETDVTIQVIISDREDRKKLYEEYPDRIRLVLSERELEEKESVADLDFEAIEEAKGIQEKVETQLRRYLGDPNLIKLRYYRGLSFWLGIFRDSQIDGVIRVGANHGQLHDGIPVYYAALKGIPSYSIEPFAFYKYFIYDETAASIVESFTEQKYQKIGELLREEGGKLSVFQHDWDQNYKNRGLITWVYKTFGFHMLDFCRAVFQDHSLSKPYHITGLSYTSTYRDRRKSYRFFRKLRRWVERNGEEPVTEEPFVYIPLQMEPEGRNCNYTIDSQIVMIKAVAEALPDGWKIYVKEHPHQYMLDTAESYYYMTYIEHFKTEAFYQEIRRIKNVRLIRMNEKGLLEKSRAVVSRAGTIMVEAVEKNIPVILCDKCYPLYAYDQVFYCGNVKDIQEALVRISDGCQPDYSTAVPFFNRYTIDSTDELPENVVGLVKGAEA